MTASTALEATSRDGVEATLQLSRHMVSFRRVRLGKGPIGGTSELVIGSQGWERGTVGWLGVDACHVKASA